MGEKLEQAGRPPDAIRSYRQAPATLGGFFPGALAAERPDALAKAHPDLYAQVLRQPINSPGVTSR